MASTVHGSWKCEHETQFRSERIPRISQHGERQLVPSGDLGTVFGLLRGNRHQRRVLFPNGFGNFFQSFQLQIAIGSPHAPVYRHDHRALDQEFPGLD